jgi:Cu-processing system permease protein
VSVLLLALFALAADQALGGAGGGQAVLDEELIGATLLGTAAFSDLLLGAVVAVFLSHSAIRGDAERGLLQPVLVRPVSRGAVVLGRAAAGAAIAAAYTLGLWLAAVGLLRVAGGWSPEAWLGPGLAVAGASALVAVTAVTASSLFPAMVAGSLTLVLVGLGFTVGLLAQLGEALDLEVLADVADVASLALPFEALYRHALALLSSGLGSLGDVGTVVGPFGGAREASPLLAAWIAAWVLGMLALAVRRIRRMDV